jgi:uncharacterized membrane protein YecN with MAPEG domain
VVSLPITSVIAGIFAVLMVPLSLQISMRRARVRVVYGDADDRDLRRKIRAHGNFIEYAPTALIVLALVELAGVSAMFVWFLGGLFVLSRVLHAIGMLYTSTPTLQALAMIMNHAAFLVSGTWLVYRFV